MKKLIMAVTALMLAASTWAGSQAGMNELRVDGVLANTSVDKQETTVLSGQVVFNRFLYDQFSIGGSIRPLVAISDDGRNSKETDVLLFFLGRCDFYLTKGESSFVPYAGPHAGIISYSSESGGDKDSASVLTYGLQGGGKIFVSENTSLNLELDLSIYKPKSDSSSNEKDVVVTSLLFGYSIYF